MLGYFCKKCQLYFRELELLKGKVCPHCCKEVTVPRLILGGQVIGREENLKGRKYEQDT